MRGINRVASALLGLVLIAFGLLVALEAAWIAAGRAPLWLALDRWYANLTHRTLGSVGFLVTAIVVAAVGLIILVLEVLPRKPDRVVTGRDEEAGRRKRDGRWWLRRRSVERRAATMAATVTGVNHARAHVVGRPQSWHLRLAATGLSERRDAVNRAVREELQRLDVDDRTEVEVDLRRPGRRVS